VILAPVTLADEPQPPQPAAPPSQSDADDPLAEAKRLEEVGQLSLQGRYREATAKARQVVALWSVVPSAYIHLAQGVRP
jgi:hypothetical protein